MSPRFAMLAAAAAAVLPLAAATPAAAHDATFGATVKIIHFVDQEGQFFDPVDIFDGKLTSKKQACVTKRRVLLYRRQAGPDKLIGELRATSEGFWHLNIEDPGAGTYYARVQRKNIGPRGHRHICAAAVSPARAFADTDL